VNDGAHRSTLVSDTAKRLQPMRRRVLDGDTGADGHIWSMYAADVLIALFACRDQPQAANPIVDEVQALITETKAVR
jgi:hypothetical protein